MQTEPRKLEQRTEHLERRVDRIEETLPSLATTEALRATEQRLRTEITDAEQRMRTHFDVVRTLTEITLPCAQRAKP